MQDFPLSDEIKFRF